MICPKCSFEQEATESCVRCGVVFSKVGGRPARNDDRAAQKPPTTPRQAPRPSPTARSAPVESSGSLQRILSLVLLLSAVGVSAVYLTRSEEVSGPEPAPIPNPVSTSAERLKARAGSSLEPPAETAPGGDSNLLVLPNLEAPSAPVQTIPERAATPPASLPRLTAFNVNDELLERAEAVARDYPDSEEIRSYLARAYFYRVGAAVRQKDYVPALRFIEKAEAWGGKPGEAATFRAMIYLAQAEYDLAKRWAEVGLAYGTDVDPAFLHFVVGKVHYEREELSKAVAAFESSLEFEESAEVRSFLERAMREDRVAAGFDRHRLSHFIVRYEGDTMEDTGRMVLDSLERSYATLTSQLSFSPPNPVVVILYSRRSYREMGGPHWSAGYFDGKIRVPVQGLERLDSHLNATLHHELAHAFVHGIAGDNCPRWLQEGMAEYAEGTRTAEFGKDLAKAVEASNGMPHCIATARCDIRLFYNSSASLVEFIHQRRGMPGLRSILEELGKGQSIDDALRTVTGKDQLGLVQEWEHFIRRRYS